MFSSPFSHKHSGRHHSGAKLLIVNLHDIVFLTARRSNNCCCFWMIPLLAGKASLISDALRAEKPVCLSPIWWGRFPPLSPPDCPNAWLWGWLQSTPLAQGRPIQNKKSAFPSVIHHSTIASPIIVSPDHIPESRTCPAVHLPTPFPFPIPSTAFLHPSPLFTFDLPFSIPFFTSSSSSPHFLSSATISFVHSSILHLHFPSNRVPPPAIWLFISVLAYFCSCLSIFSQVSSRYDSYSNYLMKIAKNFNHDKGY